MYRTIGFTIMDNGGVEQVVEHLENKILKLKKQIHLDISKELAEGREQIILDFYNKMKMEK